MRKRPDVRLCVLSADGRMFCAGGAPTLFMEDLRDEEGESQAGPPVGTTISRRAAKVKQKRPGVDNFSRILLEWSSLPQFTICCMNGSAIGGGVGLAAACDMVIAVRGAYVTLSDVKLGIIPSSVTPFLMRALGGDNCRRLLCTAEHVNMTSAVETGLVQRIVNDQSEFPAVVKEIANKIQLCAPEAVGASKAMILNYYDQPISESMIDSAAREYARVRRSCECEEGMSALASKKRPNWVNSTIAVREA